ncbi:hypothetical protein BTURTLESOX_994 [bacterium endosymbiont of Bathymodiolus sp. 5 South]|nr:hypothetical protein BTURTLESOX_994 [bacterium endosymbiont of Bathymodiolus sp. 5 South]
MVALFLFLLIKNSIVNADIFISDILRFAKRFGISIYFFFPIKQLV